jgi:hypothetical protein
MAHIGQEALRAMMRARGGRPEPELVLPSAMTEADAKKWDGVYEAENNRGRIELRQRGPQPRLLVSLANIETDVKLAGTQLLIDCPLAYGAFFTPRGDDAFEFESRTYRRVPKEVAQAKPAADAYPARWNGLIGEYGWDHDVLYILEREGKLHALIEWFYQYPIDEIAARATRSGSRSRNRGSTTASRFASSAAAATIPRRRPSRSKSAACASRAALSA